MNKIKKIFIHCGVGKAVRKIRLNCNQLYLISFLTNNLARTHQDQILCAVNHPIQDFECKFLTIKHSPCTKILCLESFSRKVNSKDHLMFPLIIVVIIKRNLLISTKPRKTYSVMKKQDMILMP